MTADGGRRPATLEPTAFLADRDLFGDLIDDRRFVAAYTSSLQSLHQRGARTTLEHVQRR